MDEFAQIWGRNWAEAEWATAYTAQIRVNETRGTSVKHSSMQRIAVVAIALNSISAIAGQSLEGPVFEVASLKRIGPTSPVLGVSPTSPSRYVITHNPMGLLSEAFDLPVHQFVNPDRVPQEFYQVVATLPEGRTSKDDIRKMLINLLIERFRLRYHFETRERERFELLPGNKGHKLTRSSAVVASDPPPTVKKGADGMVEFPPGEMWVRWALADAGDCSG